MFSNPLSNKNPPHDSLNCTEILQLMNINMMNIPYFKDSFNTLKTT